MKDSMCECTKYIQTIDQRHVVKPSGKDTVAHLSYSDMALMSISN